MTGVTGLDSISPTISFSDRQKGDPLSISIRNNNSYYGI
jgi:hypothetical protein